jgi:tRNA U34 2-thiouridine synthase MnmA/TrmU
MLSDHSLEVTLLEPTYGVAPGQFGVLYTGTKLIGGGRITSKLNEALTV